MEPKNSEFDVVIVGAGPAGLSAAIWCSELGLSTFVLEAGTAPGGQLNAIYGPINNYPGIAAESGEHLAEKFLASFSRSNAPIKLSARVTEIDVGRPAVQIEDGREFNAGFVIVAAGVRRRRLNVPGEDRFSGKGIISSGTRDRETASAKIVAIVGGGDAALENALILSPYAKKVYVVHRRNRFTARDEFIENAAAKENVEFLFETEVNEIAGRDLVESIAITTKNGRSYSLPVDIVLIRIGVVPNSELLREHAAVDEAGYVRVDPLGRTSVPRIYAIGDVAMPDAPTIATAAGMGASAAKSIRREMDSYSGLPTSDESPV